MVIKVMGSITHSPPLALLVRSEEVKPVVNASSAARELKNHHWPKYTP